MAELETDESDCNAAVTVIVRLTTTAGAVKRMLGGSNPSDDFVPQLVPPDAQLMLQVTAAFAAMPFPVTFAVNVVGCPGPKVRLAGLTVIEALLFTTVMVTVADALLDVFALETAVTVTVGGFGTLDGAV